MESANNVQVYAGGCLALKNAQKYLNNIPIKELLYGVPDFGYNVEWQDKEQRKFVFCMVGSVCKRKAQDIFLDAIEQLSFEEKDNVEFWIIGDCLEMEYYSQIEERSKVISGVKMLGSIDRMAMTQIYSSIDILVCPSREDPLPVVVVDAMISKKPSIVSTKTGYVDLLEDKINGFICNANDVFSLAEKMRWILNNKSDIKSIGENARQVYEEKFSMHVFEREIDNILDKAFNGIG